MVPHVQMPTLFLIKKKFINPGIRLIEEKVLIKGSAN